MFVAQKYIGPKGSGRQENEFFSQKGPKKFSRKDFYKLNKEDKEKMRIRYEEAREKLEEAFLKLPSELFLVLRYGEELFVGLLLLCSRTFALFL